MNKSPFLSTCLVAGGALALGASLAATPRAQASSSSQKRLQVRAHELVLPDGTRLENGMVLIVDGRIRSVGSDLRVDENVPLVEHDGVLTAGLVACQTRAGASKESRDTSRSVMPTARLVYAFDEAHSDLERALAVGVTTLVLTPASDNLAGGVTAVLKSDGSVLKREAHLSLSFSNAALGHPGLGAAFAGEPESTERSRRGAREPTSYAGALRILRGRFANGGEAELDQGLFRRAASGDMPVFLEAWNRHEVVRAARFAKEFGLRGAIRGAPLAGDPDVLSELVASGLGVVLGPFRVGHRLGSLESVKSLQEAGVPVAFAMDAPDENPEGFRLSACLALSAGAEPNALLRSLTQVAAEVAGVQDRVGSLEVGKDADLVLWSGDPLDLSSRVEAVYLDGKLAWSPKAGTQDGGRR